MSTNIEMTLDEFIFLKDRPKRKVVRKRRPHFLWSCATNCFTRWSIGHSDYISHNDTALSNELYHEAHAELHGYDIIINTNWLNDTEYVQSIQNYFGVGGFRHAAAYASIHLYCARESRIANARVPLLVRKDTMELLRQGNDIDLRLYHDLTGCGVHGIEWPREIPGILKQNHQHTSKNKNVGT